MTVTCTADAAHIICQSGLGEENMIYHDVHTFISSHNWCVCSLLVPHSCIGIRRAAEMKLLNNTSTRFHFVQDQILVSMKYH